MRACVFASPTHTDTHTHTHVFSLCFFHRLRHTRTHTHTHTHTHDTCWPNRKLGRNVSGAGLRHEHRGRRIRPSNGRKSGLVIVCAECVRQSCPLRLRQAAIHSFPHRRIPSRHMATIAAKLLQKSSLRQLHVPTSGCTHRMPAVEAAVDAHDFAPPSPSCPRGH